VGGSDKRLKRNSQRAASRFVLSAKYYLDDQVREADMGRTVICMGQKIYLVGKREGKRLLWGPQHIWQYNIKMNLTEIGWQDVDLIHLIQDRDQC
jgi:hypothetical protein